MQYMKNSVQLFILASILYKILYAWNLSPVMYFKIPANVYNVGYLYTGHYIFAGVVTYDASVVLQLRIKRVGQAD